MSVFNGPPARQRPHRVLFIAIAGAVAVLITVVGYLLAHRSVHPVRTIEGPAVPDVEQR